VSSAFLLLLLSAAEHQYYANAFAARPLGRCAHRLYASPKNQKKGFGSSSSGTSKNKKRKIQKEPKKYVSDLLSMSTESKERLIANAAESAAQTKTTTMSPVMAAYEVSAKGKEMQQRGQLNGAVSAFMEALALHPTTHRRFLLGMALEENSEPLRAVEMYDLACQSSDASNDAILRHDAAIKLADLWANDLGDVERAIRHVDEAMGEEGYEHSTFSDAAAMDQKAFYLAEQGKLSEAIGLWDAAIDATEQDQLARRAAVADSTTGEEDEDDNFSRAIARAHLGRFFRAVAKALLGRNQEAKADFTALPAECQYIVDSWNYIAAAQYPQKQPLVQVQQNEVGRLFTGTHTILEEALASSRPSGLVCEFGVFHGRSTRIIASTIGPKVRMDGFDTFEGIPEAWGEDPAGTYTAASEIPQRVPENVRFHVGLFEDTLPGYVASLAPPEDMPVRFINVDCDLYQGTVEILHHLANRIGTGSVIVFDEYLMTKTWPEDEYKAFQEACTKFGWEYEYLSFSLFSKQVIVRIIASESFVWPCVAP